MRLKSVKMSRRQTLLAAIAVTLLPIVGWLALAGTNNKYFEIAKNIEIFANVYKELNTAYVDDIDPGKLMRTGIDAMVGSLDPFTNYISEADIEGYRLQSTGKYGGIGIRTDKYGDAVMITEIYDDSPAAKAGLQVGDAVVKVEGKPVKGKDDEALNEVLRGAAGTKVALTIRRAGSGKMDDIELTREEIKIPNVPYSGMLDDGIGYISLTTFTEDAGENVAKALQELKSKNTLKGVILDLRFNGGGLLTEAVNVINVFEPKNTDAVAMRSKVKEWDKNFRTLNTSVDEQVPVAVLINDRSASASEIVSGALQDLDRAVLVGQKSYGKGLVQNTRDVGYNAKLKLTTAKYYIPSGRCIQAVEYKNGEPVEIADSLKVAFKTHNGRTIYDGGGIIPDIKLPHEKPSPFERALLEKHTIFDYATDYHNKHTTIADAKTFRLTDADYTDFVGYAKQKGFAYDTDTEKLLKQVEDKAKAEKMTDLIRTELAALRNKISTEKQADFTRFKKEINATLEREIVGRYYAQKGKIQHTLAIDDEVREASAVLRDDTRYNTLLKNTKK